MLPGPEAAGTLLARAFHFVGQPLLPSWLAVVVASSSCSRSSCSRSSCSCSSSSRRISRSIYIRVTSGSSSQNSGSHDNGSNKRWQRFRFFTDFLFLPLQPSTDLPQSDSLDAFENCSTTLIWELTDCGKQGLRLRVRAKPTNTKSLSWWPKKTWVSVTYFWVKTTILIHFTCNVPDRNWIVSI